MLTCKYLYSLNHSIGFLVFNVKVILYTNIFDFFKAAHKYIRLRESVKPKLYILLFYFFSPDV